MTDVSSDEKIAYGRLMHQAMRGLIKSVLTRVAEHGLPGEHHFFITFDTRAEDAQVADWLRDRYPEEMTIVIQHWFDGLSVDDDGFDITLYFGDQPESLRIPFDAILTFVDPSVEFGLRFETRDEAEQELGVIGVDRGEPPELDSDDEEDGPDDDPGNGKPKDKARQENGGDAEVVSLDSFRKSH